MMTLAEYLDSIMHDTSYLNDNVLSELYAYIDAYLPDTVTVTDTIIEYLWMHDTVYIHDTVYVGVDEVEAVDVKLYQRDGNIVVEGAGGMEVAVYDALGRQQNGEWKAESGEVRIAVPTSGVYLVKVGQAPARKVVVIR